MTTPSVIDLLGVLAYGELTSFERTTQGAALAPTLADKVTLAAMAAREYANFERLCGHLQANGVDPLEAMQPFVKPLNDFHANLEARNWLEGLMKSYVGDGIAADFYREISMYLDVETTNLVIDVLSDTTLADFALEQVKAAIAQDPKIAGRLALWGRRMMGEMISQATVVAGSRPALQELFLGSVNAAELAGLVNKLTVAHARRMDQIGLAS
ncbi:MAG: ferritin-like fold-containing protein [Actinomycetes bacterium]